MIRRDYLDRGSYVHEILNSDGVLVRRFEERVVDEGGFPELHGVWEEWWPDGTLAVEQMYRNDLSWGVERNYHPNGALAYLAVHEAGNRSGPYIEFSEDGRCTGAAPYDAEGRKVGLGFYTNDSGSIELVKYEEDRSMTSMGTADLGTAIAMFKSAHDMPDEFVAALDWSLQ